MLHSIPMVTSFAAYCDPQEKPRRAGQQTFLVADDDPAILRLVRRLLEAKGHRVLCGSNGCEALQLSRDLCGELHLVITDAEMPGMSGMELSEHLKADRPRTPCSLISGRRCTAELPFLAKPFSPIVFYKQSSRRLQMTADCEPAKGNCGFV